MKVYNKFNFLFLTVMTISLFSCHCQKKVVEESSNQENTNRSVMEETKEENSMQYGMFIASGKVDCVGMAPKKCMLTRASWENEWSVFHEEIEGFEYEEDYEYHITVLRTEPEIVPADASKYKYELMEVISKKKKDSDLRMAWEKPTFEGEWKLAKMNGEDVSNFKATILFKGEQVALYTGCNFASGATFSIVDEINITFNMERTMMTKKMCMESIENEYLSVLRTIDSFHSADRILTLYTDGKTVLEYIR